MGIVRQRAKGSPTSALSSVYSGSTQSLEEVFSGSDKSPRRKTSRQRQTRSSFLLTLVLVVTISCGMFLLTFTAVNRNVYMRSLQGKVVVLSQSETTLGATHFPPRVIFLHGSVFQASRNRTVDNEFMSVTESTQPELSEKPHLKNCVPLADWMTHSYPNCNSFHEINLPNSIAPILSKKPIDDQLDILGRGWFRTTWQWDHLDESVVLKTLRLEREFLNEYYDLHNRDALAMERLTASPHVVDVYGYCGQSAINELADFPFEDMQYLEKLSRRMRGLYDHESLFLKLSIATNMARGLADVHRAGGDGRPLMAHYDINPRNIAMFFGARPKINDFNIAEFLHYNPHTNKTCGFPSRMHTPWWRAPEEMDTEKLLDEKVDVYSLGSTLFHLFSSFSPRGKMIASREEMVREWVKNGKKPILMAQLRNSTDPIAIAFRRAIDRCHVANPSKRASAEEIADILTTTFEREQKAMDQARASNGGGKQTMNLASKGDENEDVEDGSIEQKG